MPGSISATSRRSPRPVAPRSTPIARCAPIRITIFRSRSRASRWCRSRPGTAYAGELAANAVINFNFGNLQRRFRGARHRAFGRDLAADPGPRRFRRAPRPVGRRPADHRRRRGPLPAQHRSQPSRLVGHHPDHRHADRSRRRSSRRRSARAGRTGSSNSSPWRRIAAGGSRWSGSKASTQRRAQQGGGSTLDSRRPKAGANNAGGYLSPKPSRSWRS